MWSSRTNHSSCPAKMSENTLPPARECVSVRARVYLKCWGRLNAAATNSPVCPPRDLRLRSYARAPIKESSHPLFFFTSQHRRPLDTYGHVCACSYSLTSHARPRYAQSCLWVPRAYPGGQLITVILLLFFFFSLQLKATISLSSSFPARHHHDLLFNDLFLTIVFAAHQTDVISH